MDGDFSMTVFVPKEGTQLPELTYEEWSASRSGKETPTNLQMPRFEVDGDYKLNDALQGLGMTDAFGGNADFSKMSKHPRAISNVRQLSKIIVDEKGTEAAAITIIEVPDGIGPDPEDFQDFNVDRPFYFTIQKANVVLFVGRVTQLPGTVEKVDGVAAVASHQDAGRCYDVQGRQLLRAPKKGFYIQDGQNKSLPHDAIGVRRQGFVVCRKRSLSLHHSSFIIRPSSFVIRHSSFPKHVATNCI